MMKYKISILSIAMAAIMLVSMSAVATAAQPATVSSAKAPSVMYIGSTPQLFVQGANGDLYWKNGNGGWQDVGVAITSAPSAVLVGTGLGAHITVLFTMSGGILASTNFNLLGWSALTTWPGLVASGTGPAAVVSPSGTVWAFYVDSATLNLMVDQSATTPLGSPTAIANLGGVVTATPAVTAPFTGWTDAVVRGTGGHIWQKTFETNAWSPNWAEFHDGTIGLGASLVSTGGTNVALFVTGSDYHLYELTSSNYGLTWAANSHGTLKWTGLGGVLASQPSGVYHSGTTYVDVLGGGGIWTWSSSTGWSSAAVPTP